MAKHLIKLHGCDETTAVTVDLGPSQLVVMQRIAEQTRQASEFACQPYMSVDGIGEGHHD